VAAAGVLQRNDRVTSQTKTRRDHEGGEQPSLYGSSQVRFLDFIATYKQLHVGALAPGPKQKYESLLQNHILPAFGCLRLCDIGTQEIQTLLNQKANEGLFVVDLQRYQRNFIGRLHEGEGMELLEGGEPSDGNKARTEEGKAAKEDSFGRTDESVARRCT
jgi:hypothetical protein